MENALFCFKFFGLMVKFKVRQRGNRHVETCSRVKRRGAEDEGLPKMSEYV